MRTGFLKGAWRHAQNVPKLIFSVRGWPNLLRDCLGRSRTPYQLRCQGSRCEVRHSTSDWWIFLEIFVFGNYNRAIEDIRKAKCIIDIGANVGFFAIFASSINPDVEIHAFEPFPKNVEQMNKNLLLNTNRKVKVWPNAVSNKSEVAELFFTPGDDSGCSLNQQNGQSCAVDVININNVFELCKVESCDLLKMDCEGSELAILEAMSPNILGKIRAVIMEYHHVEDVPKITNLLTLSGFKCELHEQIHTLYAARIKRL